jgi:hypothetical protein
VEGNRFRWGHRLRECVDAAKKDRSLQRETPIKFKSDSSVGGSDVRSQFLKFTFGVRWVISFRSILLLLSFLGFNLIPLIVSW